MKTRVLLFLIIAVLAHAPLVAGQTQPESAQAATWSRYTYAGEEFSAELARDIAPIDDVRSTARYRTRVAQNLLGEFLSGL